MRGTAETCNMTKAMIPRSFLEILTSDFVVSSLSVPVSVSLSYLYVSYSVIYEFLLVFNAAFHV